MKVGILTFHLGPNHGGYLQAYCLSHYIQSLGHEVEIINYKNAYHHQSEKFKPWVYRRPTTFFNGWMKNRVFKKAYKQLNLSRFTTTVTDVDWPKYDAVVVGSDVVWDFSQKRLGQDPIYFGNFGKAFRGRRISYAPSSGKVKPTSEVPIWAQQGLSQFDDVSVRDDTTRGIVEPFARGKITSVVDPTWLDLVYDPELDDIAERENILAVYAFELSDDYVSAICEYAKAKKLKIVALGYPHRWADENRLDLGPVEWPDFMKRSKAVIAGTFHGTLYAIKTQSNFVTILNDAIFYKVQKPLEITKLKHRILKDPSDLQTLMDEPINYKEVMGAAQTSVINSQNFLKESLSNL